MNVIRSKIYIFLAIKNIIFLLHMYIFGLRLL